MAGGEQRDGLNLDILGSIPCLQLALPEQRAIADFLDRETGKIDRLAAKKRELIEKLKEKRAALISRTVTRGLNPDATLKPSGIEWLGDVPEHWEVKRGRYIGTLLGSVSPGEVDETDDDNGIPFAKVDDLNRLDSSLNLTSTFHPSDRLSSAGEATHSISQTRCRYFYQQGRNRRRQVPVRQQSNGLARVRAVLHQVRSLLSHCQTVR